ncbi:hypothetical protein PBV87_09365 [Niameybacter massiliensis]|uniref:Uncharacterized protein n=1 Tax=Holtiella tumoricola TaxID=3018743 RepID=A0AA42DMK3_9FIRM|nr:hypothetical protein [Holtiella tumoricola]MDA3731684.1 hypothetical protein [Holtiella tumoricola]
MIDTAQYPVQVRANARLVDAGRKKVEKCPAAQQTEICVVLIADYEWQLEGIGEKVIPEKYQEEVKKELGLTE